ncbi:MAG TPA: DUF2834 domain-containing protein [Vicinamibacterales bacterium]|nr:DUF2834 domain-containing protein [Vicinamibacterales bacterium]
MSTRPILLAAALVIFIYQTLVVLTGMGYAGFIASIGLNEATKLTFLDLAISLLLIMGWMWQDAAARRRNVIPYLVITVLFGSAGPLLYLLMERKAKTATALA